MKLVNKRIALFVASVYNDLEFWYPYLRMKEEGARVDVIGPEKNIYTGRYGLPAKSDYAISSVKADDFNGLIVPYFYYADEYMEQIIQLIDFMKLMHQKGKIIAITCHDACLLVSAGIVKGKKITGLPFVKENINNAGGEWIDQDVIRDGNIITSGSPMKSFTFCRSIIEALSNQ